MVIYNIHTMSGLQSNGKKGANMIVFVMVLLVLSIIGGVSAYYLLKEPAVEEDTKNVNEEEESEEYSEEEYEEESEVEEDYEEESEEVSVEEDAEPLSLLETNDNAEEDTEEVVVDYDEEFTKIKSKPFTLANAYNKCLRVHGDDFTINHGDYVHLHKCDPSDVMQQWTRNGNQIRTVHKDGGKNESLCLDYNGGNSGEFKVTRCGDSPPRNREFEMNVLSHMEESTVSGRGVPMNIRPSTPFEGQNYCLVDPWKDTNKSNRVGDCNDMNVFYMKTVDPKK